MFGPTQLPPPASDRSLSGSWAAVGPGTVTCSSMRPWSTTTVTTRGRFGFWSTAARGTSLTPAPRTATCRRTSVYYGATRSSRWGSQRPPTRDGHRCPRPTVTGLSLESSDSPHRCHVLHSQFVESEPPRGTSGGVRHPGTPDCGSGSSRNRKDKRRREGRRRRGGAADGWEGVAVPTDGWAERETNDDRRGPHSGGGQVSGSGRSSGPLRRGVGAARDLPPPA